MKITYKIEKHEQLGKYILWKETKTEHGLCVRSIFQGTKKECEDELLKIRK